MEEECEQTFKRCPYSLRSRLKNTRELQSTKIHSDQEELSSGRSTDFFLNPFERKAAGLDVGCKVSRKLNEFVHQPEVEGLGFAKLDISPRQKQSHGEEKQARRKENFQFGKSTDIAVESSASSIISSQNSNKASRNEDEENDYFVNESSGKPSEFVLQDVEFGENQNTVSRKGQRISSKTLKTAKERRPGKQVKKSVRTCKNKNSEGIEVFVQPSHQITREEIQPSDNVAFHLENETSNKLEGTNISQPNSPLYDMPPPSTPAQKRARRAKRKLQLERWRTAEEAKTRQERYERRVKGTVEKDNTGTKHVQWKRDLVEYFIIFVEPENL